MAVKQRIRLSLCVEDLNAVLTKYPNTYREFETKHYVSISATIFDDEPKYGNVGTLEIYAKGDDGNAEYCKVGSVKAPKEQEQPQQQARPKIGLFD